MSILEVLVKMLPLSCAQLLLGMGIQTGLINISESPKQRKLLQ